MQETSWYKDAVFYELYIRAFADSNGDGCGDLPGVITRLDYLQALGVDCIWLLPMYPSPLLDDGYDISDYTGIHPDYGTLADLERLTAEAHARGMRVIVDLVMNHCSDQHPWFQSARRSPDSPYRDYFVWSDTPDKYKDTRIIFIDTEESNWTYDPLAGQYYWHRFYSGQPDLNYENPAVQQAMLDIMDYWMQKGIDGFRADAVPYLFEAEGTSCENLAETHQYLKRVRAFLDERYPAGILLAEANQWPEDLLPYFGQGDEMHMAFNFPAMPRIFQALKMGSRTPVVEIMGRLPSIPEQCQWCVFLRNHDELTLEMVSPEVRQYMWEMYAPEPRMRINLGIRRRLAPLLDNDRRKLELANSILLTLPGAPIVYYGDEIGMGDDIGLPDRNGVRTPMQWNAGPNAGFSTAPADRLYSPAIGDETYGYQRVNVAAQQADPGSLWNWMRRAIAVRKAHPAFSRGGMAFVDVGNDAVLAYTRSYAGERLLVLHNLRDSTENARLASDTGTQIEDLLTGASTAAGETPNAVTLEPYGYRWWKLA